ncbi:MAG: hypothetical protein M1819_005873 [Sarea resinae]|nr:MAG: hypothetical protein M1819_005873 [Sarea resinae]
MSVRSPPASSPTNARSVPPAERLADHLEKPSLDDRSYRVIRLANKLEALLVHDPDTDKASAALDVNVGNFSDPSDLEGLAHCVEHMLFMGTEKYPKENEYSQYLSAHSGYSNAYTAATSTNFYFEIAARSSNGDTDACTDVTADPKASPLYGALDRFAQFFISPLFLSETLDRELRAVDSENKKNLQIDDWRIHQLNKALSNTKHPYHHFSTGNLETLRDAPRKRGVDVQQEFMKFHEKEYSANRMKLVVLGRESLDELESWVEEFFSGARNKDLPRNRWDDEQPLTEKELQTQIFVKPVMDTRSLDVYFPYQDEEEYYESQPSRYLSHLIGHEGPGSILAYIKAKGWANGLSSGPMPLCPGSALFTISIRLTEEGLANYPEIVKIIFQYIALMRDTPPQKWIVEEMMRMAEVDFRFKQKTPASRFTSKLAHIMQKPLPRDRLLSNTSLIRKFDSEAISRGLSYLRPDNFRINVVSQEYPGDWDQKERWYGTEYRCEKIPADTLAEIKKAAESGPSERPSALRLPHVNEFIPKKLEVEKKEVKEPTRAPVLLRNDDKVRAWWKKDDRFWVPKANVFVTIRNPLVNTTPESFVKASLFCELVKDALVEYSYDAEIAGLDYMLSCNAVGLDVELSGYNDKMPVLLEKVLVSMRDLEVKPDRFKIIKERTMRRLRNAEFQQPYSQVGEYTRWLNSEKSWIGSQYLDELSHLTAEDIIVFFPQLIRQAHVEALIHGNLYKEDALKITDLVESILKPRSLPQSQWNIRRSPIFPGGSNYVYPRTLKDPANINHCIEYLLFVGENSDSSLRAKTLLLAQMADEPAFHQLRTKEQLGYVVLSGVRMAATTISYRIIIQSEKPPEYLEKRINSFLIRYASILEKMPTEEFEGFKRSLINKRQEKLKNLNQESVRFWNHIGSEYFDFEQVDKDVAHITPLTKQDMQDFFTHYVHPASTSTRAKVSIHLIAQASPKSIAEKTTPAEQLTSLISTLSKYLNSVGVPAETEKLTHRFEKVDLAKGDEAAIVKAVSTYLSEDLKVEKEKVDTLLVEGKQLLGSVLPSLGIEILPSTTTTSSKSSAGKEGATEDKGESDEDPVADAALLDTASSATVIKDVYAFKAGLAITAGARAVRDLSEFEELESKL